MLHSSCMILLLVLVPSVAIRPILPLFTLLKLFSLPLHFMHNSLLFDRLFLSWRLPLSFLLFHPFFRVILLTLLGGFKAYSTLRGLFKLSPLIFSYVLMLSNWFNVCFILHGPFKSSPLTFLFLFFFFFYLFFTSFVTIISKRTNSLVLEFPWPCLSVVIPPHVTYLCCLHGSSIGWLICFFLNF